MGRLVGGGGGQSFKISFREWVNGIINKEGKGRANLDFTDISKTLNLYACLATSY